jgi:hypothetical protein
MVLVMARQEAGPCEWKPFSDDAQKRVGKKLLAANKPNRKQAE